MQFHEKKRSASLWFALLLYWLLAAGLVFAAQTKTGGHFGYPLDDTYIHMAIAKHLAVDGDWGVSQFGFSSSTSSPLWTFLISLTYMLFGVNESAPFLLAFIAGNLVVAACYAILSKRLDGIRLAIFLAAAVILTPLAMLSLSGMEHILHGLFTVLLLFKASDFLSDPQPGRRDAVRLALLAASTTLTRYEGLFLVFSICLFLLLQKRILQAVLLGAAGWAPVAAYGLYSISKGWLFLPNSILLKGNTLNVSPAGLLHFFQRLFDNISSAPQIPFLLLICLGMYRWARLRGPLSEKEFFLLRLFLLTTTLHMLFASVGWFYRYDAYLILTGILVAGWVADSALDHANSAVQAGGPIRKTASILFGIFLLLPLAVRAELAHYQYSGAVKNIHDQQYQMGLFMREYYPGSVVAANDIGAINFLADVKTLDLYGLGSLEVARLRRNGAYDSDAIRELAADQDVEIIVIYKSWYGENIPPEWEEVGSWQIADNVVCADDLVSFYVRDDAYKREAISHLRGFASSLPPDVVQAGEYILP